MLRSRALITIALALAACHRNPPPPPPPETGSGSAAIAKSDKPLYQSDKGPAKAVYRTAKTTDHTDPEVAGSGKLFMVVSEAKLASKVGHDILVSGGNAVDAAVATAFALAVVHPTAGNIAGGGFAVVRTGAGKARALDFRETAPAAASPDMYLDAQGKPTDASLIGYRASGVPGSVAGLFALHEELGKKPWKDVVAPAIKLAREGFPVDQHLHDAIEKRALALVKYPATGDIWVPNRIPRAVGATVAIPELATVLQRIADQGPDGFYKGETGAAIVNAMRANGGLITYEDLATYRPVWREPLRFSYRGYSIVSMPPPSSGGIAMAMTANMLRTVELGKLPWHGAEHLHWLAETWRRAFAARNEVLGDPAYVKDMPIDKLLSAKHADQLAATITDKATPSKDVQALIEGNHTTNLCVVDRDGMAVAMTTTLNTSWGSGVTISGFLMNNEMDDFASKPGSPNVFGLVQGSANKIEPGKRMLSSMSPTIVESSDGNLAMLAGAGGGPRIITAVWQTISNVLDFGEAASVAVAAPRVHHQHLPDILRVESESIDAATETALRSAGYTLDWADSAREFGAVNAIVKTPAGWDGAADPRGGGGAVGE